MHSLRRLVPIAILSLIAFAACKLDPKNDTAGIYAIACNGVDDSDLITRAVDAINEANVPAELRFGPGKCANVGTITISANGVHQRLRLTHLISDLLLSQCTVDGEHRQGFPN
jgi:hypothetical protein